MTPPRTMAHLRALSDAELGCVTTSEIIEALFLEATSASGFSGDDLDGYRAEERFEPWFTMLMLEVVTQRSDVILRALLLDKVSDGMGLDQAVGRFYRAFRVPGPTRPARDPAEESARLAAWLVDQYQTNEHHPPRITLGEAIDALGRERTSSGYRIVAALLGELGWDRTEERVVHNGVIHGFYWSPTPAARGEEA